MEEVLIEYYGHSCFKVTCNDYSIVFDPYNDNVVPGLFPLQISANQVLISHNHEDHNAIQKVKILRSAFRNPFEIYTFEVAHDDANGEKRGMCTVHILEGEGYKIAHLGDIGRMLNIDEIEKLKNCDCLMIPIGGFFTIDGEQAKVIIEKIQPKVAIVMHYRTDTAGYGLISHLNSFKEICPELECLHQSSISLNSDESNCRIIALEPTSE